VSQTHLEAVSAKITSGRFGRQFTRKESEVKIRRLIAYLTPTVRVVSVEVEEEMTTGPATRPLGLPRQRLHLIGVTRGYNDPYVPQ
jgi:hypothetical protein